MFNRTDWAAAGIVALVALTIYFVTLAPTVTADQSAAFAVAGDHLGIGRVPGYPFWHILAKVFTTVFGFVRYRGHPNPAWATNFMSAVFGALSCGLIALLVARVGRATAKSQSEGTPRSFVAAVAAGILFAVSHTMWSQSVITETHTLTLFCILLFLVASLAWLKNPCRRSAFGLAAAFGLAFAQSHMIVLLAPVLLLALLLAEPRLCRELFLANFFLWILPCILLNSRIDRPWLLIAIVLSVILGFALPLRLSSSGSTAMVMLLLMAMGLASYVYLPIACEGKAPMQFSYARTWEGFVHAITRGQYERISPTDVFGHPLLFLSQIKWYINLQNHQFIPPAGLLAVLPIICISRFRGVWRKWWILCLLSFFVFSVVLLIGVNPHMDVQDTLIQKVKFIPGFALWSVFMGLGLAIVLGWIERLTQNNKQAPASTTDGNRQSTNQPPEPPE